LELYMPAKKKAKKQLSRKELTITEFMTLCTKKQLVLCERAKVWLAGCAARRYSLHRAWRSLNNPSWLSFFMAILFGRLAPPGPGEDPDWLVEVRKLLHDYYGFSGSVTDHVQHEWMTADKMKAVITYRRLHEMLLLFKHNGRLSED
jgi:hypothetical protein